MTDRARQLETLPSMRARRAACVAVGLALAACTSLPQRIDTLEQARSKVQVLRQDPMAREAAASELDAAQRAIAAADKAYDDHDDLAIIEHDAYMAKQHAGVAEQQIAEAHAQKTLAQSREERDRIQLQARRQEARSAQAKAQALQQRLDELKAAPTHQGLVLTLGNVLFDTDRAALKPGAMPTIDRLADFLHDYPQRRVLIEGYTDSRGSDSYNLALSQRRADAVGNALEGTGIAATRVRMEGFGEAYPVASNSTTAGMQQNRRVEIVISDNTGEFPASVQNRLEQATDAALGS